MASGEDEPIDINLDEEPVGVSPLDSAAREAAAALEEKPSAEAPAETASEALAAQIAKLKAEKEDLLGTMIRRQADFENYRKRVDRERQADSVRAAAALIESILPVLDAFDRALAVDADPAFADHRKGFELIDRQLWDALGRYGLERIQAVGQPFDPNFHQAVERVESADHEEGTVLAELQAGFKLRDKVLRPTMVRVAARPSTLEPPPPALPESANE